MGYVNQARRFFSLAAIFRVIFGHFARERVHSGFPPAMTGPLLCVIGRESGVLL